MEIRVKPRIALTVGLPTDIAEMDLVHFWRKYLTEAKSIPPVVVNDGPLLENVATAGNINLAKIPTPRWHEDDGYRASGSLVIRYWPLPFSSTNSTSTFSPVAWCKTSPSSRELTVMLKG